VPPYLPKRKIAERYSVTVRTIERMWRDGRLPPPEFTLGPNRPFNDLEKLEAAERAAIERPRKQQPEQLAAEQKPAA
jgi:hypothetical protein